jgi:hypothetical protein
VEMIPEIKRCNGCKEIKPVSDFQINDSKKNNLGRYTSNCKACCQAQRTNLRNAYIASLFEMRVADIPEELLAAKREQLKLMREINEKCKRTS